MLLTPTAAYRSGASYVLLSFAALTATAHIVPQCPGNLINPFHAQGHCMAPMDDDSPPKFHHRTDVPWSHHPYCISTVNTNVPEKLCVYSSTAYNDGTGVSVVARPWTAASMTGAIQDTFPAWIFRRHLAHQGRWVTKDDVPYTVAPVPGKGLGVVATRRIKQFETIMTGFPAMIIDKDFLFSGGNESLPERTHLFQTALDQLADQERFLSLAKGDGRRGHVVEEVARTNAFGITINGREMNAVYPEIAVGYPPRFPWDPLQKEAQ